MIQFTRQQATAAYDILVSEVGAQNDPVSRDSFVIAQTDRADPVREYRFQGTLGFGGKFRNNGNRGGVPYVDCYPEDETPERRKMIDSANAALRALFAQQKVGGEPE